MNKKVFGVLLVLMLLLVLTGCFKKSLEQQLCSKVDSDISQYNKKQISFDDLANKLSVVYNDSCQNTNNKICSNIQGIIDEKNSKYEIEDCSKYKDSPNFYKACESTNKLNQKMASNKAEYQKAAVYVLSKSCEKVK